MKHITISALFTLWVGPWSNTAFDVYSDAGSVRTWPPFTAACRPLDITPFSNLLLDGEQDLEFPTCPECAVLCDMARIQYAEEKARRDAEAWRMVAEDELLQYGVMQ